MVSKNSDIYSVLAKKHGLHKNIVSMICNHPFIFASRRISDPDDEKTLMFIYLFKIKLKNRLKGNKRFLYGKAREKALLKRDGNESV
jgi:hypothetical protein